MKILILGDIHGRTIWKKIIETRKPDLTIFLGDYVSSHLKISEKDQIDNFEEILKYKEANPDKVILLRGNHDIQHMMGNTDVFECSGYFPEVGTWCNVNYERILKDTQWVYVMDDIIFSHAGITDVWFEDSGCETIEGINKLPPCELFGFRPTSFWDMYGDSPTQGCTWVRPGTLAQHPVKGYTQVVGHTGVKEILDIAKAVKYGQHIWLCDRLPQQCLMIEDGEFMVVDLKDLEEDKTDDA